MLFTKDRGRFEFSLLLKMKWENEMLIAIYYGLRREDVATKAAFTYNRP